MADPRRMSTGQKGTMGPPETPSRVMQASPNLFPGLQFSPDLFSPANMNTGNTTAYPQQRLFWDSSLGNIDGTGNIQQYQDPFAMEQDDLAIAFGPNPEMMPSYPQLPHLPEQQSYNLPTMARTMSTSYIDRAVFPAPFTTSPRISTFEENPSMFLSSPARRFGNAEVPTAQMPTKLVRERPAYHHQIEESRREQENKRVRRSDVKHPSVTRSVMEALRRPISPVKDSRPGLKRSLTHSGVGRYNPHNRHQSHVSFLETMSNTSGSTSRSSRNGRASPTKSLGEGIRRPSSSNYSTGGTRTSLSLAIDEHGVAKTIITKVPEDQEMDIDGDSSDSEASSRDESDFHVLRSQQGSFAYMDDDDGLRPTVAGLSNTHGMGHSKTSSYSTMTSSTSAQHSSRTSSANSAPNTRTSDSARGQRGRKYSVLDPMIEQDSAMEDRTNSGDAQQALREIIQDRSRSISTQGNVSSNQQMNFTSSPPIQQHHFSTFNASPTTITDPDLATPSTGRGSSVSNGSTRCVCNSTIPDGSVAMIQCNSCMKWLHATCVGIDSRRVPDSYICVYCSQTPMRQSRVREPYRTGVTSASPLAHKSQRKR